MSESNQTVAQAGEALRAMLSPSPDALQVAKTVQALEELRIHLSVANETRISAEKASQDATASVTAIKEQMAQLDTDIIQAKLEVGELLTARDSVARDLARARRTFEGLDGEVMGPENEEGEGVEDLFMHIANEMEKMKVAEEQLVKVVDDINVVRKGREQLERKMKAAQEDW